MLRCEQALALYKKSLEYFMTGLKYEKNPQTKQVSQRSAHAHS
jgi:hypothetical protein